MVQRAAGTRTVRPRHFCGPTSSVRITVIGSFGCEIPLAACNGQGEVLRKMPKTRPVTNDMRGGDSKGTSQQGRGRLRAAYKSGGSWGTEVTSVGKGLMRLVRIHTPPTYINYIPHCPPTQESLGSGIAILRCDRPPTKPAS